MSTSEMTESSPTWTGPDKSIFDPFTIHQVTYKTIDKHDIQTAILIPKSLQPGPHPILINMHGGFLIMGHALFSPFFAPWLADLITSNNAICLDIDYRLLPTARGVHDVLDDLEDFWTWFKRDFPSVLNKLAPGRDVDFGKVVLTGGSAGGYTVLQTALSHPDEINAVAMMYPLVDLRDDMFTKGPPEGKTALGFPPEALLSEEDACAWAKAEREKKEWRTQAGFELIPHSASITQYGRIYDEVWNPLGSEDVEIHPLERIRAGAKGPGKIWILTGEADSAVRVAAVRKAVALMKEKLTETEVRYDEAPGQDHGYDILNPDWEQWSVGSLDWLKKAWLEG